MAHRDGAFWSDIIIIEAKIVTCSHHGMKALKELQDSGFHSQEWKFNFCWFLESFG